MVLENNLIFSLIVSIIISVCYYLFSNSEMNSEKIDNNESKNNIIILFGICFISIFIFKIYITNINKKSGETLLTHSSRPPF